MCLYPVHIKSKPEKLPLVVPCGKCLECVRSASVEWAFRILDECSLYEHNCFITLTYNNDNLPDDLSVHKGEHQRFMKRLRKALAPLKIRFFVSGEYGKKLMRPHYHYIIFNWFPDDAVFFKFDKKGTKLFRSKLLETVWTKGFSSVGEVTYDTALYAAKYLQKFQFQNSTREFLWQSSEHSYESVQILPPFVLMSNRPGIGYNKVYDVNLNTDRIYYRGRYTKIPRYYLKVMERDGIYLDDFKARRKARAELMSKAITIDILNSRRKRAQAFLRDKKHLS